MQLFGLLPSVRSSGIPFLTRFSVVWLSHEVARGRIMPGPVTIPVEALGCNYPTRGTGSTGHLKFPYTRFTWEGLGSCATRANPCLHWSAAGSYRGWNLC